MRPDRRMQHFVLSQFMGTMPSFLGSLNAFISDHAKSAIRCQNCTEVCSNVGNSRWHEHIVAVMWEPVGNFMEFIMFYTCTIHHKALIE